MSLQNYLFGAWLFACYCAAVNDRKPQEREFGIVVCFLATALLSLAWPVVVLVYFGMAVRRMLVRGA